MDEKKIAKSNQRKLRVAISIWMFKPGTGGLQAHAEALCHELQKRGHEVVVITRAFSKVPKFMDYLYFNEKREEVLVNGVKVRPLRFRSSWKPVQWLLSKMVHRPRLTFVGLLLYRMQALAPAIKAFSGFDLIHHIGQANALLGFAAKDAAKIFGIPFFVQPTCHPNQAGDSALDHRLFCLADCLLVHTQYEKEYFLSKRYQMPILVVGNGIMDRTDGDADRFRRKYGIHEPFVLFIGRKCQEKGFFLLTKAFRKVHAECPGVSLVCLGPPDHESAEFKIGEGILNLDFISEDDKHDALAACLMLCVPSEGESFGLVFMEAGRYRKPVVARALPVLQELLGNGTAGLLLGAENPCNHQVDLQPSQLARALINLIRDKEKQKVLGENSFRVSDSFTWNKVIRKIEAAYRNTMLHNAS